MNSSDKDPRIVIVGGVAGGASAAARARRCNPRSEITVLEKGSDVSFANCGLPYHIGGEIEERDKLLLTSPKLFWDRFRISVRTGHCVTKIDRKAKTVTGTQVDGQEFKVPYDKLILATGSQPNRPPFCDEEIDNLFTLWTLDDMDQILAFMKNRPCRKAVVVGGGFVGLEAAEQLKQREVAVEVIQKESQVLAQLDTEFASLVQRELKKQEICLHLNASVDQLLVSNNRATALKLATGETVTADIIILAAGTRPRVELAIDSELDIGPHGGVRINEFCQTSDPDVYAVGDIVEYPLGTLGLTKQLPAGQQAFGRMPFAGPANRAGRVAGTHAAAGHSKPLGAVQGTSILRVFNVAIGNTGLTEKACRAADIPHKSAIIQATHHASYFPGARAMTLKLLYSDSGLILGAQAIGREGIDKRIDVIASMLQMNGTVDDLADLDLSYAPPFGSAKDPVHMAAFVAQNDLAQYPTLLPPDSALDDYQIVDVRNATEFDRLPMHQGAIHIPVDELTSRLEELDASRPTVTICHSGKRAHVAACLLQGHGFNVKNLSGGMSIRALFGK